MIGLPSARNDKSRFLQYAYSFSLLNPHATVWALVENGLVLFVEYRTGLNLGHGRPRRTIR